MTGPLFRLGRRYRFAAAHTLRSPWLSADENRRVYGKCAHSGGHGHEYVVEVIVAAGSLRDDIILPRGGLDDLVERIVAPKFAYRDLNESFGPGFITTGENLARATYDLLAPHLPANVRLTVRVVETEKNAFAYRGAGAHTP